MLQRGLQVDTAASVDLRLQRFVEERIQSDLAVQERVHRQPGAETFSSSVGYVRDTSELRAWNPVQRRVLWSVPDALPGASRTLVTAGGLVFYGTRDGWVKALDARSGRELWKHRVPGGRLAEASSYRGPDGHQYIAVRAVQDNPQGEREPLLLFALAH
jgi:outer membrane protein assembly factor BamB